MLTVLNNKRIFRRYNEETPLAMSRVSKFGNKTLTGLPKVMQVYNFSLSPSMPYYPVRCTARFGNKMSQTIKKSSSRLYLSHFVTCEVIAARDRSCALWMRRKAIVMPRTMVASINLNMKAGLAMLSISRDLYKRCCTSPALVSQVYY